MMAKEENKELFKNFIYDRIMTTQCQQNADD